MNENERAVRQNRSGHLVASRWDHVVASDPGGARLVSALEVALSVGVTIALEYGFSQLVHPLWISAPPGLALPALQAARFAAQHHGVTELSMLIGGIVALVSTLVNGSSARNRAVTIVGLPVPFLAMFALGIELVAHHTLGLVVFTLVVAVGVYARKFVPRFGPRAFVYGNVLFVGYLFGFLAGRELRLDQLDWLRRSRGSRWPRTSRCERPFSTRLAAACFPAAAGPSPRGCAPRSAQRLMCSAHVPNQSFGVAGAGCVGNWCASTRRR